MSEGLFSNQKELLPEKSFHFLQDEGKSSHDFGDSLVRNFSLPEHISQLCKNPRELAHLETVANEAKEIDSLIEKIVTKGGDLDTATLDTLLCALQGHLDTLQKQKPTLTLFAETNATTAEELETVSVCFHMSFISCCFFLFICYLWNRVYSLRISVHLQNMNRAFAKG